MQVGQVVGIELHGDAEGGERAVAVFYDPIMKSYTWPHIGNKNVSWIMSQLPPRPDQMGRRLPLGLLAAEDWITPRCIPG